MFNVYVLLKSDNFRSWATWNLKIQEKQLYSTFVFFYPVDNMYTFVCLFSNQICYCLINFVTLLHM